MCVCFVDIKKRGRFQFFVEFFYRECMVVNAGWVGDREGFFTNSFVLFF